MTAGYNRSPIVSFFELEEKEKQHVIDCYFDSAEEAEESTYVFYDRKDKNYDVIPMCYFMLTESKIWHGSFVTSNTSALVIRLSKSNDEVLIAHKYW